jgi:hypothetical protein
MSMGTVLYLAYGSNLSAETFKGSRGIRPLSQVNVIVPELALTFDLPGIPYLEPCFANTRYRTDKGEMEEDYHKDRWKKGLVGVVYEVTKADYAVIIATEGGGASYEDVLVDCYEIPPGSKVVNPHPESKPFRAHTLFAPQDTSPSTDSCLHARDVRPQRPDPSYAQASARYLKLITDGAAEHNLPEDYQEFLHELRPYIITSIRQRLGQVVFAAIWMPLLLAVLGLGKIFADKQGKLPAWLTKISNFMFTAVWLSYDSLFKRTFGDGERTEKRGKVKNDIMFQSEKIALLASKQKGVEFLG